MHFLLEVLLVVSFWDLLHKIGVITALLCWVIVCVCVCLWWEMECPCVFSFISSRVLIFFQCYTSSCDHLSWLLFMWSLLLFMCLQSMSPQLRVTCCLYDFIEWSILLTPVAMIYQDIEYQVRCLASFLPFQHIQCFTMQLVHFKFVSHLLWKLWATLVSISHL